jgi:hypothetical protein
VIGRRDPSGRSKWSRSEPSDLHSQVRDQSGTILQMTDAGHFSGDFTSNFPENRLKFIII